MDFRTKNELSYLARIVEALNHAAPEVEWLLVGALARDLLLELAHGVEIARRTNDVDFAVAVQDWKDFYRVRDALLASGNFETTHGIEHRVLHRGETRIDLVPFGGIESPAGTINWPPEGNPVMNVVGFSAAMRTAIQVFLPNKQHVKVVCLPMLLLLKLIAWRDRRHHRPGVDAGDILLILRNYTECGNLERISEEHSDLLESSDFDYEISGSILAGRDIFCLLSEGEEGCAKALTLAQGIVSTQLAYDGPGPLIADAPSQDMEAFRILLKAFSDGLASAR